MNKENESPYCEICGTCGCIDCCGIRNFISEHIEGKTNCKNESWIIQDLIDLCDYKDKVFEENERLNNIIKLKDDFICDLLKRIYNSEDNELHKRVYLTGTNYEHKLKELKEGIK